MRAPIFVWQPNELLAFSSVEEAEGFVEPYDVNEGTTYDADGRLLVFELEGDGHFWQRRVVLRARESQPTHDKDLRLAILQASEAAGAKAEPSASLEQLVEEAHARFSAPRSGLWRKRLFKALGRTRTRT